jgi:hypothetical protein
MERVATAVSLVAIAVVMFFTVIDREAPYKVIAKPLEGRIHLGRESEPPNPAVSEAQPSPQAKPTSEAAQAAP